MSTTSPFEDQRSPLPGRHQLPPHFSGVSVVPRPRRKARRGLVFGILGGVLVVVACAAVQIGANLRFDDAAAAHVAVGAQAMDARSALDEENADLATTTSAAEKIIAGNTGALMESAPIDAFSAAIGEAKDTSAAADELLTTDIPRVSSKPGWFWELFGGADALDRQTEDMRTFVTDLEQHSPEIVDARTTVTDTGVAVLAAAASAAPAFEAAHISARNLDVIALRDAADGAATVTMIDDTAVERIAALQSAAAQVVASQDAELAEKSGPLMNARLEVEAFARSLAPGVLLEFDWAPVVSGAGYNGSMGGYTTWWWNDPDRAVIQLSNSVAEQWPAERSRALVAHEVGHAISVKCENMYDSSTQDSIEKWATAWAISMGFTDDANGVWAYGYPPQSYIDAAAGCR